MFGAKRAKVVARVAAIEEAMAVEDAKLEAASRARRDLHRERRELRRQLHPNLARRWGRQPDLDGAEQLPPVAHDATPLWGRRLRSVCITLLRRSGRLSLVDLHVLLHRHGYVLANETHVKALADAMGYEADQGRVRRVHRGVYEVTDGYVPRRGRHGDETLRVA